MTSTLLVIAVFAVCGLMLWASHKMEPHYVSRDGGRMIVHGQGMSRAGQPSGRWRELRVQKIGDRVVEVRPRRGTLAINARGGSAISAAFPRAKRRAPRTSTWSVLGQAESPAKNRVLYILDGNHDPGLPEMLVLRLPTNSKAIPMLEAMAVKPASPPQMTSASTSTSTSGAGWTTRPPRDGRGTRRWASRPDRG
ncbi:MAG: hypothetical protein JWM34_1577 [Ilumatobacteraceae bacterium]|nr:hypothetical protein [Ilumatobacteraceae bacterium]